ncbi:MAG: hypothetical protein JNM43_00580 [Planctomycetaceae bacterium]|nr:hypothetical protein [Planctomycetaceae bacterium]
MLTMHRSKSDSGNEHGMLNALEKGKFLTVVAWHLTLARPRIGGIVTDKHGGFEFLPFLRSPGGCLVMTFLLMLGGCVWCEIWLSGANQYTFDLGRNRRIVVLQARDKEWDQWTTYDFKAIVIIDGNTVYSQHLGGTADLAEQLFVRIDQEGNLAGVLWPGSTDEFLFVYDFSNNTGYPRGHDEEDSSRMKKLASQLNSDPNSRLISAQ